MKSHVLPLSLSLQIEKKCYKFNKMTSRYRGLTIFDDVDIYVKNQTMMFYASNRITGANPNHSSSAPLQSNYMKDSEARDTFNSEIKFSSYSMHKTIFV